MLVASCQADLRPIPLPPSLSKLTPSGTLLHLSVSLISLLPLSLCFPQPREDSLSSLLPNSRLILQSLSLPLSHSFCFSCLSLSINVGHRTGLKSNLNPAAQNRSLHSSCIRWSWLWLIHRKWHNFHIAAKRCINHKIIAKIIMSQPNDTAGEEKK